MTTSGAANVYTLAIKGDFDDCQRYVKKLFLNQKLKKKKFWDLEIFEKNKKLRDYFCSLITSNLSSKLTSLCNLIFEE